MAMLFLPTGEVREVAPAQPPAFTLEELQRLVGGNIQVAPKPDWARDHEFWHRYVVVCDGDGRLKAGARLNERISYLADQRLFGDVVVLSRGEWEAFERAAEEMD